MTPLNNINYFNSHTGTGFPTITEPLELARISHSVATTFWDITGAAIDGARNGGGLKDTGMSTVRNGAILGIAAGVAISALTAGAKWAAGAEPLGFGKVVAELSAEAVARMEEMADRTIAWSTNIALSAGPASKKFLAASAILGAATIIKKAQLAQAVSQVEEPSEVAHTTIKAVSSTAFRIVMHAALKGALAGALAQVTKGPGAALLTHVLYNYHTSEHKINIALRLLNLANFATTHIITTKLVDRLINP